MLQDGSIYRGYAFGADNEVIGEVVFTTANVGYPESLTDSSYKGQILVFTSPLIGNYGTSPDRWESDSIQVSGAVIFNLTMLSHYTSIMSLDEWFRRDGVPGIYRVDTRALTVKLREVGVMMGAIADDVDKAMRMLRDAPRYDDIDFTRLVTPSSPIYYGDDDKPCIGIVDCSVKMNIAKNLLSRGFRVVRYPCHMWREALNNCDGVLLSNGPGNPNLLTYLSDVATEVIRDRIPTLGICLGPGNSPWDWGEDLQDEAWA